MRERGESCDNYLLAPFDFKKRLFLIIFALLTLQYFNFYSKKTDLTYLWNLKRTWKIILSFCLFPCDSYTVT